MKKLLLLAGSLALLSTPALAIEHDSFESASVFLITGLQNETVFHIAPNAFTQNTNRTVVAEDANQSNLFIHSHPYFVGLGAEILFYNNISHQLSIQTNTLTSNTTTIVRQEEQEDNTNTTWTYQARERDFLIDYNMGYHARYNDVLFAEPSLRLGLYHYKLRVNGTAEAADNNQTQQTRTIDLNGYLFRMGIGVKIGVDLPLSKDLAVRLVVHPSVTFPVTTSFSHNELGYNNRVSPYITGTLGIVF